MKSFLVLVFAVLCLSTPTPSDLVPVAQDETRAVDPLIQGYWSCTVNPNNDPKVVYTQKRQQVGVCGGTGQQNQYFITYASDNLVSCSLPDPSTGWTYNYVQENLNPCEIGRFAKQYTLRKPYDGLRACNVPSGYTYFRVDPTWNCQVGKNAAAYALVRPAPNQWACWMPGGWTASRKGTTDVCTIDGKTTIQYLLKKA